MASAVAQGEPAEGAEAIYVRVMQFMVLETPKRASQPRGQHSGFACTVQAHDAQVLQLYTMSGQSGSMALKLSHADEPGARRTSTRQPGTAGEATCRAAMLGNVTQQHTDTEALSDLGCQALQLEVDALNMSTKVWRALGEVQSQPRIAMVTRRLRYDGILWITHARRLVGSGGAFPLRLAA